MPDFTRMTPLMLEVLDKVNAQMDHTGDAISRDFDFTANERRGKIDYRDFKPMTLLFAELQGEGITQGQKQVALDAQVREMEEAFDSGDPARKKPYLDMIYDLRDNFDPTKIDLTKEEDIRKLYAYVALNQTYATKRIENPEYYEERYADPAKRAQSEAMDRYSFAVAQCMMDSILAAGKSLKTQLTLPASMPGMQHYAEVFYDASRADVDRVYAAREGREVDPVTTVKIPAEMRNFNVLAKIDDLSKVSKEMKNAAVFMRTSTVNSLHMIGTEQGYLMRDGSKDITDMLFIDGKSVREIQQEKYPNLQGVQASDVRDLIIAQALVSGKNRIELAQFEKNAQNGYDIKLNPIRTDITAVQPSIKEDYGWFRRTFLNWGPMKCKTRQEKADALLANDPDREARLAAIKAKVQENVIEPSVEARQKAVVQKAAKAAAAAARERTSAKKLAGHSKADDLGKTNAQEVIVQKDRVKGK